MPGVQADSIERDITAIARIGAVPTILRTIRESTGLRFTLVARVLPDRWIACAVHDEIEFGLGVRGELDVATTLCSRVRDTLQPVIIDHVEADPVYCEHPTPKMYGFESYIAVPIFRRNGAYFGNICGLDPLPRQLRDGKTLSMMQLFSELISLQLEAEERHEGDRLELARQREAGRLREEFIAVLGHDVRNPLQAIGTGVDALLRRAADDDERRVLERVRSSTRRIGALVDDLLDLARGRLGGGIALDLDEVGDLEPRLRQVVAEVQALHSAQIALDAAISDPVRCDPKRMEQLLSNLLSNAVQHGATGSPVHVSIRGGGTALQIDVVNQGETLSEEARRRLFQPYFRAGASRGQGGLGLGLFIVAEIAKSHGGRVEVTSEAGSTRFAFSMG